MKHRIALVSFVLLIASMSPLAQTPATAPIPVQIAAAKTAFLANAGDADSATLNLNYNAVYAALQSWGKYQLTATPADAELVLELRYDHALTSSMSYSEQDTLSLHILDRATHTILWSVTVNVVPGSKAKSAARSANDIIGGLKSIAQTNASVNAPTPIKTRLSDEKK